MEGGRKFTLQMIGDKVMARPRPEKKRKKAKPVQPPLPGMPPPEPPGTARVLPMQLQIGDRMIDSTGEWEVVGRPYTTNGRKNAHVRVRRVSQPGVTETKMWGAYEKVTVIRRATAEGQAMMRLPRTSVIVVLSLLTSAATANA